MPTWAFLNDNLSAEEIDVIHSKALVDRLVVAAETLALVILVSHFHCISLLSYHHLTWFWFTGLGQLSELDYHSWYRAQLAEEQERSLPKGERCCSG